MDTTREDEAVPPGAQEVTVLVEVPDLRPDPATTLSLDLPQVAAAGAVVAAADDGAVVDAGPQEPARPAPRTLLPGAPQVAAADLAPPPPAAPKLPRWLVVAGAALVVVPLGLVWLLVPGLWGGTSGAGSVDAQTGVGVPSDLVGGASPSATTVGDGAAATTATTTTASTKASASRTTATRTRTPSASVPAVASTTGAAPAASTGAAGPALVCSASGGDPTWSLFGGYRSSVTVTNDGDDDLTDWTLTFAVADGLEVSEVSGAGASSQSGGTVTVAAGDADPTLEAGASVTVSYRVEDADSGDEATARDVALDGVTCS